MEQTTQINASHKHRVKLATLEKRNAHRGVPFLQRTREKVALQGDPGTPGVARAAPDETSHSVSKALRYSSRTIKFTRFECYLLPILSPNSVWIEYLYTKNEIHGAAEHSSRGAARSRR